MTAATKQALRELDDAVNGLNGDELSAIRRRLDDIARMVEGIAQPMYVVTASDRVAMKEAVANLGANAQVIPSSLPAYVWVVTNSFGADDSEVIGVARDKPNAGKLRSFGSEPVAWWTFRDDGDTVALFRRDPFAEITATRMELKP